MKIFSPNTSVDDLKIIAPSKIFACEKRFFRLCLCKTQLVFFFARINILMRRDEMAKQEHFENSKRKTETFSCPFYLGHAKLLPFSLSLATSVNRDYCEIQLLCIHERETCLCWCVHGYRFFSSSSALYPKQASKSAVCPIFVFVVVSLSLTCHRNIFFINRKEKKESFSFPETELRFMIWDSKK